MEGLTTIQLAVAGVASRDPGLGHYLRYGAILLAAIAFIAVWMARTWRNAPDPEERWREARRELEEPEDAESQR